MDEITSGSMLDPPATTRCTESMNSSRSSTRLFSRYPMRSAPRVSSSRAPGVSMCCDSTMTAMFGNSRRILQRGRDPVAGERRRHPDVGDDDLRTMCSDLLQEVVAVARLGHDLVPLVTEDASDPLTEQDVVLGDDQPHTSSARNVVPRPRARLQRDRPVQRRDAVLQAAQPEPWGAVGQTPAVVGHRDLQSSTSGGQVDRDLLRRSVFDHVGQRLRDNEVGGRLDLRVPSGPAVQPRARVPASASGPRGR